MLENEIAKIKASFTTPKKNIKKDEKCPDAPKRSRVEDEVILVEEEINVPAVKRLELQYEE